MFWNGIVNWIRRCERTSCIIIRSAASSRILSLTGIHDIVEAGEEAEMVIYKEQQR